MSADPLSVPGRWRRLLGIGFLSIVLLLVAHLAARMDWASALQALRALPLQVLLAGAALGAASHLLYCSYDLIGRHQSGHRLAWHRVVTVAFMSYAFNLNLGSLVGGVALRYRLYSRLGLGMAVITQVLALSMLTNWLGHLTLSAAVLLLAPPVLPPAWHMASPLLQGVGLLLGLAVAAYLFLCTRSRRREWRLRSFSLRLPLPRTALLQVLLSSVNWMLIAAVLWTLLQHRLSYGEVLAVLLVAAVAGVVTHVPAGLGVLEAVFIAMLGHRVPVAELLAALLAYRLLYYLAPLALAGGLLVLGHPRAPGPGHVACRTRLSRPQAAHAERTP